MQVAKRKDWQQRNLFYLSKMYCEDLRWGEDYGKHRMRDADGDDFTDLMELHIIELRKCFAPEDSLSDWVKLFNATTEEELDMIKTNNIGIQAGIQRLREMSLTKRIRAEIEYREKARRDRMAELAYARDEGMAKGMENGQKLVNSINTLNIRLIEDGRLDDLKRAAEDAEFRKQLMDEYEIK